MYSYSSHPVWIVLKELNLPDELVDKIMGYKTFYSPIDYTFTEYSMCLTENKNQIDWLRENDLQNYMVNLLMHVFNQNTINVNYYNNFTIMNNITTSFIAKYMMRYKETPKNLFKMIMDNIRNSQNLQLANNERTENSISLKNTIEIISANLKFLLTSYFIKLINSINLNIEHDSLEEDLDLFYDYEINRFELSKLWFNICYIFRHPNIPSKTDLLMFNYMYGLKYKKSWTKKKLISNLMKNEPNNDKILEVFLQNPGRFNMKTLYNTLKKCPFSSPSNKTIDIHIDNLFSNKEIVAN